MSGRRVALTLLSVVLSGSVLRMNVPSPINESVLKERLSELGSARSLNPRILSELESFVRTADDYDLFRINPIQYGSTAGLSESVRLKGIEGTVPGVAQYPSGCRFHPRCPLAEGICAQSAPVFAQTGKSAAACHFAVEATP